MSKRSKYVRTCIQSVSHFTVVLLRRIFLDLAQRLSTRTVDNYPARIAGRTYTGDKFPQFFCVRARTSSAFTEQVFLKVERPACSRSSWRILELLPYVSSWNVLLMPATGRIYKHQGSYPLHICPSHSKPSGNSITRSEQRLWRADEVRKRTAEICRLYVLPAILAG